MTDATKRAGLGKVIYSVDDKADEPTQREEDEQSKPKFGRRSRSRFPPAILPASPVGPARTRSRTRRYLRVPARIATGPRCGRSARPCQAQILLSRGDEHEIVGKPEPEPEEIVVDDALQPPQRGHLTLDGDGAEEFVDRGVRLGVRIAARIPARRVISDVPCRP